jgi:hypothetical protein
MPLTMETAAALVSGAPLNKRTRRVRVLRPFLLSGGQAAAAGALLDLPAMFAGEMVGAGKAEFLPEPNPAPVAPVKPAPKAKKENPDARQ